MNRDVVIVAESVAKLAHSCSKLATAVEETFNRLCALEHTVALMHFANMPVGVERGRAVQLVKDNKRLCLVADASGVLHIEERKDG